MADPMTTEELSEAFAETRALRGKKRKAAIDELSARQDALLPALGPLVEDDNKSVRELALKLLAELDPRTDAGKAHLGELLGSMLASHRPKHHDTALERIGALGARVTGIESALREYAGRSTDEGRLLRVIAELDHRVKDTSSLLEALDPLLDSWSSKVHDAAAQAIRERGEQPRASVWAGAPLAPAVIEQVQRLGGRCSAPFDPAASRSLPCRGFGGFYSRTHGHWSEADPQGTLTEIPAAIHFFEHNVGWSRGTRMETRKYDEVRTFDLTGASENFDTEVDGRRVLLHIFVYDELAQFFYCLDLFDERDDPAVFIIDHDGSDPHESAPALSKFLSKLWLPR